MSEDPELTVGLLAARFDDEYPDSAPEWVADRAVASIRTAERTRLLAALLADRIEGRRRYRAREIEHRAAVEATTLREREEREAYAQSEDGKAEVEARQWEYAQRRGRRREREAAAWARVNDPALYAEKYDYFAKFLRALEAFRSEIRLELTVELLGSTFKLGDGHVTTWGAATVDQHRERIDLLLKGMEGTARTAALHEKAMDMLTERNAACLNDVRFAA